MASKHRGWREIVALTLLLLEVGILGSQAAYAQAPLYVAPGGDDTHDCLSPASPCATINGALNRAGPGDVIYVAAGVYKGSGDWVVEVGKAVTLSGGWDETFTAQIGAATVDGESTRGAVRVQAYEVIIERFVIQNGVRGVYSWGSTLIVLNSAIRNNTGSQGAGLLADYSHVYLDNVTVSGNTTPGNGGGIDLIGMGSSSIVELSNCTVRNNHSGSQGGGIHNHAATVKLRNTIVADNTTSGSGPDCEGVISSLGYNLIQDTTGCTFAPGEGDLTDVQAQLSQLVVAPARLAYFPLLAGSPAIDAGNPAGCTGATGSLDTDERGAPRVGRCDMGAYEYTLPGAAASALAYSGTPQHVAPGDAVAAPFQTLVLDAIGTPVDGAGVSLTAPTVGPSGTFSDTEATTTTATTAPTGIATAATLIANEWMGSYVITATLGSVVTPTYFSMTNLLWYVAAGGNDSNDCDAPATACSTVPVALHKPGFFDGDTVLVAADTYTGTERQVLLVDRSVRLRGGWDTSFGNQSGATVLDGGGSRRGMVVTSGTAAVVERFVVRNGFSDGWAGWGDGGGILSHGPLTLSDCIIRNNRAYYGMGGAIMSGSDLTLNRSEIVANQATKDGGGVYVSGSLTLNASTIRRNVSGFFGGGIRADGPLTINASSVSENVATSRGGGIYCANVMTMTNSTVSGNSSGPRGGGIFSATPDPMILNSSTIGGNRASDYDSGGGGISKGSGSATLRNTIIAGNEHNSRPDCYGTFLSAGYNLIGDATNCGFVPSDGDLVNVDAQLGPIEGLPEYRPLLLGSPAINAGNPSGCTDQFGNMLNADQRGAPRVGRCDIGAYEASLWADKEVEGAFKAGGMVTYTISLMNLGDSIDLVGVLMTDTLPISLTYVLGSFDASGGIGGEQGGVITWHGTVMSDTPIIVTFAAIVSDTVPRGTVITNTVESRWGSVTATGTAIFDTFLRAFLPTILRNSW